MTRLLASPEALLLLILQTAFSLAQTTSLTINQTLSLDTANLPSTTFSLPKSSTSRLFVSVALCDAGPVGSSGDNARFFVTNNSAVSNPGPSSTESDVFEITLGQTGMGNVTLLGSDGGIFSVTVGSATESFQVGVSDTGQSTRFIKLCRVF